MPPADLPLSKEQPLQGQMQSAEQALSEGVVPIPPTGADAVTEALFEGQASFEGPLSKTLLEGQTTSKLHEESSSLAKATSKEPVVGPHA